MTTVAEVMRQTLPERWGKVEFEVGDGRPIYEIVNELLRSHASIGYPGESLEHWIFSAHFPVASGRRTVVLRPVIFDDEVSIEEARERFPSLGLCPPEPEDLFRAVEVSPFLLSRLADRYVLFPHDPPHTCDKGTGVIGIGYEFGPTPMLFDPKHRYASGDAIFVGREVNPHS